MEQLFRYTKERKRKSTIINERTQERIIHYTKETAYCEATIDHQNHTVRK